MLLPNAIGVITMTVSLSLAATAVGAPHDCTTSTSEDNSERTCTNNSTQTAVDCGVYMAPSTIGNNSNLGIFTGKDMIKGDIVPHAEILIPLLWRIFSQHPKESFEDGQLWDRYIWDQYVGEMEAFDDLERSKEKSSCFFPGVGCTVNSMLDLSNIKSVQGSQYDEVVDRSSPGAGAFTPYHSAPTVIRSDRVEAGQELFASYGDDWIPWIPGVAVTKEENFDKADELMHEFEEWIEEHEPSDSPTKTEMTEELLEEMWEFMVHFPQSSRPLSVLPKEFSRDSLKRADAKEKLRERGLEEFESPSGEYWAQKGKVSLDFLQQHGKCQDHIKPDISTLPHAGRGAFATRDLPKGTVVGYAPLVHVAFRGEQIFTISYDGETHGMGDAQKKPYSRPDIIFNYSFGHRNSTLLLTPYGAMVNYINHKSAKDGDGPHVRVQWPAQELVAHKPEWLRKSVDFLRDTTDKIGLSFEYVAMRDIKAGEEVFMDYGDEWASAWEQHVKQWTPVNEEAGYIHSSKFQEEHLRTAEELNENPYPWNLHTLCSDAFKKTNDGYTHAKSAKKTSAKYHCHVLERKEVEISSGTSHVYTVEIEYKEEKIVAANFPRGENGIQLFDKAYSQMWHMKNAFRHKISIPDDIFPKSWINLQVLS